MCVYPRQIQVLVRPEKTRGTRNAPDNWRCSAQPDASDELEQCDRDIGISNPAGDGGRGARRRGGAGQGAGVCVCACVNIGAGCVCARTHTPTAQRGRERVEGREGGREGVYVSEREMETECVFVCEY